MIGQIQAKPAPRRSGSSHTVIMASRAVEHQIFSLRSKGVLVKALDGPHAATPHSIGKAVEAALQLPPHLLRVTKHYPEDFFIHFDVPSHRDKAVRRGSITVDGSTFLLQAWRESGHGVFQTYNLHVRVCIEKMPLHLWSIEGAKEVLGKDVIVNRLDSRTYAQDNTKLFSCWVWCWSLDRIPSNHGFTVFPRGAGSADETGGIAPPSRVVPPAPEGIRFDALIHIDLVEDWTVREARTPSSGQSGIPSSSSVEAPPFPVVQPYTWHLGVPDGEEVRSNTRRRLLDACAPGPILQRRDDRDEDNDRHHRLRQDAALARGRVMLQPSQSQRGLGGSRRRSRTPSSRRHDAGPGAGLDLSTALPPPPPLPTSGPMPQRIVIDKATPAPGSAHVAPPPASPASPASVLSDDPLAELTARDQLGCLSWPTLGSDPMAFELDAFCTAATSRPLSFPPSPAPTLQLGFALSPAQEQNSPRSPMDILRRRAASNSLQGRSSPLGPCMLADDVSSVPSQVAQLELSQEQEGEGPRELLDVLFAAPPASILGTTPPTPRRATATPKAKTTTASRRSIRQAELPNSVPVAQRATVRLAKELDVIADDEQRLEAAAAALTNHFDYPLAEMDLDGLAVLTRIDKEAIKRAAAQAASIRAATPAH